MVNGKSNKNRLVALYGVLCFFIIALSCGAPVLDPQPGSGKGSVALFFTDNVSYYKQVIATVTGVRLINSGTAEVCDLLNEPVTLDFSNLTQIAQYADLAECPKGKYNRIDIDLKNAAQLMDNLGVASSCTFAFFLDESGQARPLNCDKATGMCTLSVRTGTRDVPLLVQEDRYNDLGIDFNLKKFMVTDFGSPSCSITMAASRMSAADMNENGRSHGVTGSISGLDTAAETFTLVSSGVSLTVDYSRILPSLQPNIDQLLLFAGSEGLLVSVLTGTIDIAAGRIFANRLFAKAAGTVSGAQDQPTWSFTVEYQPGKKFAGSQQPTDIQGAFVDGVWVNIKFKGFDPATNEYLAESIEVLPSGMVLDD